MLELSGYEIVSQTIYDLKQFLSAARRQTFICISIYPSFPLRYAALVLASQLFATLFADEVCEANCSLKKCKVVGRLKRFFALFGANSQVSTCGISPANASAVCGPSTEQWH